MYFTQHHTWGGVAVMQSSWLLLPSISNRLSSCNILFFPDDDGIGGV
jgi:hypothetical protein